MGGAEVQSVALTKISLTVRGWSTESEIDLCTLDRNAGAFDYTILIKLRWHKTRPWLHSSGAAGSVFDRKRVPRTYYVCIA